MEPRWDIAVVVVAIIAIPLAMSPMASHIIATIFAFIVRRIWPASSLCKRLEWVDIPHGPLHECTIPVDNCGRIQNSGDHSWDAAISSVFTRIRHNAFVRKPRQLDWRIDYIRTDTVTLKAMLLFLGTPSAKDSILSDNRATNFHFQQIGTLLTIPSTPRWIPVHPPLELLEGFRLHITKVVMNFLLLGYPPWYSEKLLLANGEIVPHPITSYEDISRGGWVAAVGLSPTRPFLNSCMPSNHGETNIHKLTPLERAFDRIIWRLSNLKTIFPSEAMLIDEACSLVTTLRFESSRHSMVSVVFRNYRFTAHFRDMNWFEHHTEQAARRQFARSLSTEDSLLIINVFTHYSELTTGEIENLAPIIIVALRAVLVGCWEVFFYTHNLERVQIPPELDKFQTVYLKDKYEEED